MPSTSPHALPFDQPDVFLEGQVMVIDKPLTWTSFDVVNKVRYALRGFTGVKKIKVGHAGTLDPLAKGLLIVCTGKATKKISEIQGQKKEYKETMEAQKAPSASMSMIGNKAFSLSKIAGLYFQVGSMA